MPNTPEAQDRRRKAVVFSPAGQMPAGWEQLTNAQKFSFTQAEREQLKDEAFDWAPDAPEHGVFNSYNNYYCRCPKCTRFNTDRSYSERTKNQPPVPPQF